ILSQKSYLIGLYNLESYSQEERENRICNEIFKVWGVNGFITTLFRTYDEDDEFENNKFTNCLGNLLRVWNTAGNLDYFVSSRKFLTEFMDMAKHRLELIGFDSIACVSDFFRLSLVVICLFDADKKIHDEFNETLEPNFQNALKKLIDIITVFNWNVLEMLTETFLATFMDVCKIRLQNIEFFYDTPVSEYFRISFVVTWLFDADKKIYDEFNETLEPLFKNALKQLTKKIEFWSWNVVEMLTESETDSRLKEFKLKAENYSWKPKWVTEFLEIVNIQSEVRESL
ncbi:unnamed protein product, partial [Allacma fusca]